MSQGPNSSLITTTNADLSTSSYDWDDRSVLTDVTDERSLVTTYVRNGWGEVIREDSPDSGITDYERDSAGNITKRTDARNVVTNYSYDDLSRLTEAEYPATPADDVTYTYDETTGGNEGVGRLTKIEDGSGSIAFTYDHRGNVTQEVRVIGTTSYTTSYEYDLADRVTEITYPSGRIVIYTRDTHGRVTSVTTKPDSLGTVVTVAGNITYDPFGPVTGFEHGNGLDLTRSFDLDGRITDILTIDGLTPVQDLDYGYDNANGITSITDNLVAARSETFAYNNRRRLSDADGLYGDIDYVYDAVGNRTSRVTDDGVITVTDTYTMASTSNRLNSTTDGSTTRSFTYSATGAVTEDDRGSGTPYTLVYNDEDRLVEIKQGTTTLATYEHNALGERVDKIAGSDTTHYHYAQDGRLIAESEDDGTVQREVIYLGDLPIAQVDSTGASAALYRIHADHLGTPRVMTDSSKAVVWDAVFKPFGEVQSLTGTATNDNRFQGQRFDSVAGYHYNYFRDYDPKLGRYLQSDPIGLDGGLNTYAYAYADPINLTDPYGLQVVPPMPATPMPLAPGVGSPSTPGLESPQDAIRRLLEDPSKALPSGTTFDYLCLVAEVTKSLWESLSDEEDSAEQGSGVFRSDPNAEDKARVEEQRKNRRIRRENRSRDRVGQNRSGEGFRNKAESKKGASGQRPRRENVPRPRRDKTSPHTDGTRPPPGSRR